MQLRKRKKAEHPLWRPDFRDLENLPDIKVIRTDFLLNLVSVSVAIILLGLVVVREYRMRGLSDEMAALSANISQNAATNRENIAMSASFRKVQDGMAEFARFGNVPVLPDHLLVDLVAMQPDPVILSSANFTGGIEGTGKQRKVIYTLVLSGSVENTLERPAPQVITEYRSALEKVPAIAPFFVESELSGFTRNDALGLFNFTIRVTLSETAHPAKS